MQEILLTRDLEFRLEYLWKKSLLSDTLFFTLSFYVEKLLSQLLAFFIHVSILKKISMRYSESFSWVPIEK